ncbi:MAG: hypothetical protein JST79_01250 [Acidobacteria bacterium]|nr:hypothetical protein [Acidobacteriota bacterium]
MDSKVSGAPQITPHEPEHRGSHRDPEERPALRDEEVREKALDKTLADSFPTSDPPSSNPMPGAPSGEDETAEVPAIPVRLVRDLPPGSWAALSLDHQQLLGAGPTRDEALRSAKRRGHPNVSLVEVSDAWQRAS